MNDAYYTTNVGGTSFALGVFILLTYSMMYFREGAFS